MRITRLLMVRVEIRLSIISLVLNRRLLMIRSISRICQGRRHWKPLIMYFTEPREVLHAERKSIRERWMQIKPDKMPMRRSHYGRSLPKSSI